MSSPPAQPGPSAGDGGGARGRRGDEVGTSGSVGWLRPHVRPYHRRIAIAVAAVLVRIAVSLAVPYLFKIAIDRAIIPGRPDVLVTVAAGYLVLVGVKMLADRVETLTIASVGQRMLADVRRRLSAHLQRLPLGLHERERSGGVVARVVGDVEALAGLLSEGLVGLAANLFACVGIVVVLVVLDWRLALVTMTMAPVLAVVTGWFRRRSAVAWDRVRASSSAVTVAFQETIGGIREIQENGRRAAAFARMTGPNTEVRDATRRAVVVGALYFPGVELVSTACNVLVIGVGGPMVLSGRLEIGTFTAFLLYLRVLFVPVFEISDLTNTTQAAVAGGRRIGAALAVEPAAAEPDEPVGLPAPRGDIRIDTLSFGYPDPDGGVGREVLHGITLDVPAGRTLALIGSSGAGKSTIASLLLRFHDPTSGRITLDGVDLRRLRTADLRRAVGYVPQEAFLFTGTVAENIGFGRPGAGRERIESAVAALGVRPLLDRLPSGLDTLVGERGSLLSGGERQAVAFARAWITDPAVLVLDEATSQLDPATEECVRAALRRLRRDRTTVIIAHRLANVLDADIVAVVADGRVVEVGTPAELVDAGGRFARLYHRWARR